MSDVTFTPEQVTEIRRRVVSASRGAMFYPADVIDSILAAFPLPKVTRFRTFTVERGGAVPNTYRIRGGVVEFQIRIDEWKRTLNGDGTVASFAHFLARCDFWTALAALADVAARPTEEVDA